MKSKISLITLGVTDLEKSKKFYQDLGFLPHNYKDGDDVVFFEMEGTWLSLFPKDKLASDAMISHEGTWFGGITIAHNVSSKKEVDEVYAHALTVGAKLIKKPQAAFWGGYSGYFADPDGYLWEVTYNPFTDLT